MKSLERAQMQGNGDKQYSKEMIFVVSIAISKAEHYTPITFTLSHSFRVYVMK